MKQSPRKRVIIALLFAMGTAVLSGLLYPGGISRRAPDTPGYSLTQNYFSDLGMTVSYGGTANYFGAALFVVTCAAYGYAAWSYAGLVTAGAPGGASRGAARGAAGASVSGAGDSVSGRSQGLAGVSSSAGFGVVGAGTAAQSGAARNDARRGRAYPAPLLAPGGRQILSILIRFSGALAALGFLLTGLVPKNVLFHLHNWVSYVAFLALMALWLGGLLLAPGGAVRALHGAMVLLSAVYLGVLFGRPNWVLPEGWALQVVAQRIIVVANWLALLLGVFWRGRRPTRSNDEPA